MCSYLIPLAIALAGALAGCSKSDMPASQPESKPVEATQSESSKPVLDACALLTNEEIASVQSEEVKETKKLEESEGGLIVSVCQFSLPTPGNSIILRLVQRDGSEGRDPRQGWNEAFAPEKMQNPKETGRKKIALPEKIPDLGDEAYWRGNSKSGALYVLKGNAYLRLALIDSRDKESAIKKCSALAAMALKRL